MGMEGTGLGCCLVKNERARLWLGHRGFEEDAPFNAPPAWGRSIQVLAG
jgi:hypothetical protein